MHILFSFRFSLRGQQVARIALGLALAVLASLGAPCAAAQNSRDSNPGPASAEVDSAAGGAGNGRILLVLPFDNRSGQPSLEWVREAAPELLGSRFRSAGFAPMSRADRLYALDHLGLPQGFQPSRASSLKLAQTLDADSIVVGSFSTDGAEIVAEARLVDVPHLRMGEPVTARGPLRDLIAVYDALAWKLTRQLDPAFKGSEETFIAAGAGLSVIAFEQYIRGITESDQAERLHHLSQAVLLSPGFSSAWMALGREQYSGQLYDQAAAAFAKVERSDPDALEAGFYRGLSLLFSGDYPHAEQAFGNVARELPLAEVLNNQGVAVSRQSHDGTVLFRQAIAADPSAADFHFNLAVSLRRNAAPAEALAELGASLKLRPIDSEALDLQDAWSPTAVHSVAALDAAATISATASKSDPLERMSRNFDAVAFRQAAQMLDRMNAARLAQLAPAEQALKLETQARDYLERGLLLEAERLYQSANAVDPNSAAAHAGLAQVRERAGDAEAARKEAHASLDLAPSSDACLVLARLDLAANRLDEARGELAESLKLEPNNPAAVELNAKIEAAAAEKHSGTGER